MTPDKTHISTASTFTFQAIYPQETSLWLQWKFLARVMISLYAFQLKDLLNPRLVAAG